MGYGVHESGELDGEFVIERAGKETESRILVHSNINGRCYNDSYPVRRRRVRTRA
jgi:hypothetical protein